MRPSLLQRLAFVLLPALLLASLAFVLTVGEKGILRRMELSAELRQANADLQELELRNQRLLREIHAIERDRVIVERVVAEELGWASPGTTLYRFDDPGLSESP